MRSYDAVVFVIVNIRQLIFAILAHERIIRCDTMLRKAGKRQIIVLLERRDATRQLILKMNGANPSWGAPVVGFCARLVRFNAV